MEQLEACARANSLRLSNISNDNIELTISILVVVFIYLSLTTWRRYNDRVFARTTEQADEDAPGFEEVDHPQNVPRPASDGTQATTAIEGVAVAGGLSSASDVANETCEALQAASVKGVVDSLDVRARVVFSETKAMHHEVDDVLEVSKLALQEVCNVFDHTKVTLHEARRIFEIGGGVKNLHVDINEEAMTILEKAGKVSECVKDVREKITHVVGQVSKDTSNRTLGHIDVRTPEDIAKAAENMRDVANAVVKLVEESKHIFDEVRKVFLKTSPCHRAEELQLEAPPQLR